MHRLALKRRGVWMLAGVTYERIDDRGLTIRDRRGIRLLPADNVVICAGQEPRLELLAGLASAGIKAHLIGGSNFATELDARARLDGSRLAAAL